MILLEQHWKPQGYIHQYRGTNWKRRDIDAEQYLKMVREKGERRAARSAAIKARKAK